METQAAGLQASADFTAKFWTVLHHFYGWKEFRLLGKFCFRLFLQFLIWRCLFYLGKSCSRGRQTQLLCHHVTSKLLCYCEKNFLSHACKFKIVRRILFICTNCSVFVLSSFLLVTSFEQDSEPAVVAEKMTRLLSEAEPPMRTTQDQEVGLLFLSSFFFLCFHTKRHALYMWIEWGIHKRSLSRGRKGSAKFAVRHS